MPKRTLGIMFMSMLVLSVIIFFIVASLLVDSAALMFSMLSPLISAGILYGISSMTRAFKKELIISVAVLQVLWIIAFSLLLII